jgi:hypothetical protein
MLSSSENALGIGVVKVQAVRMTTQLLSRIGSVDKIL